MTGRPAIPVNILKFAGRSHIPAEELAARQAAEIHIGDQNFVCPEHIAVDDSAYKKWVEVIGFIQKFPEMQDLITSTDSASIAMYCQTYSEELTLIALRARAKTDKGRIKFTSLLLKCRAMQLKLSQELFLTPMSKIRNVAKSVKPKKADPLDEAGFGAV